MTTTDQTKKEEIDQFIKENQKFLALEDGESVTFRLVDYRATTKDFRGQERKIIKYSCEFEDGSQKIFENGSPGLAKRMRDLLHKVVILSRDGVGLETKYTVEEFSGKLRSKE